MKPHWWHFTIGPGDRDVRDDLLLDRRRCLRGADEREGIARQREEHGGAERRRSGTCGAQPSKLTGRTARRVGVVAARLRVAGSGRSRRSSPTGPQMKTSRSAMSGTSSCRWRRREQVAALRARVVADDVVHRQRRAPRRCASSSSAKTRSSDGDDAVQRDDVAVHLLEQRADRGDADPARDQEGLVDACGCPR